MHMQTKTAAFLKADCKVYLALSPFLSETYLTLRASFLFQSKTYLALRASLSSLA